MLLPTAPRRRLGFLVDGDNAQPSLIEQMLAETVKHGDTMIRRIYGDWTSPNMNGWKEALQTHAIQPIQQFRYTNGKNATDSALIIDAMDILHSKNIDGFCLISSDSDFTRLATRIREAGLFVMGIGRQSTPRPFVSACEVFVFTENLSPRATEENRGKDITTGSNATVKDSIPLLTKAFELAVQEDGWAALGNLGHHVRQLESSFDPRSYGHAQLKSLIEALPAFFHLSNKHPGSGSGGWWVKLKNPLSS
jgi:uncharacterized LabA/DUF88 family protein